jgi:hypothetical protein
VRTLVVGPYPPTTDPAAGRTLALVRALAAGGDTVEVLAPTAGAAHHAADLQGLLGALAVARRARAFDRVVVCLEPALFNRWWVSRPRRVLDRLALGLALRRTPARVELRVDTEAFPGAPGAFPSRFLWQAAALLVVPDERDRATLRDAGGVPDDRIEVLVPAAERPVREPSDLGWRFDGAPTREEVMAVVRARAAEERATAAAGAWAEPPPWPEPPRPGTGATLPRLTLAERLRPYGSVAKRTLKQLLGTST